MTNLTMKKQLTSRSPFIWTRFVVSIAIAVKLIGISLTSITIAAPIPPQNMPVLIATAYTDITLPTLRKGDRGKNVRMLQKILSDNGFLHAAGIRLGNPQGSIVDGVFGSITESAVKDLQQRYKDRVRVTGQVNPQTWELLDMQENPYRSPLPWK